MTHRLLVFAVPLLLLACAPSGDSGSTAAAAPAHAVAQISPAGGSGVSGTVTFTTLPGEGVKVDVELSGLTPGKHGFHVHENGDCSDDAKAAGGHFNPEGTPHGDRTAAQRHVGDLGNVTADAAGKVKTSFTDTLIALAGPHSILDRAVVVHGGEDDLTSQPSGNAGPRVACGVIHEQG
jgi:Cu-Zn family superoxide dismutase